jgi:hypothetical protein
LIFVLLSIFQDSSSAVRTFTHHPTKGHSFTFVNNFSRD